MKSRVIDLENKDCLLRIFLLWGWANSLIMMLIIIIVSHLHLDRRSRERRAEWTSRSMCSPKGRCDQSLAARQIAVAERNDRWQSSKRQLNRKIKLTHSSPIESAQNGGNMYFDVKHAGESGESSSVQSTGSIRLFKTATSIYDQQERRHNVRFETSVSISESYSISCTCPISIVFYFKAHLVSEGDIIFHSSSWQYPCTSSSKQQNGMWRQVRKLIVEAR